MIFEKAVFIMNEMMSIVAAPSMNFTRSCLYIHKGFHIYYIFPIHRAASKNIHSAVIVHKLYNIMLKIQIIKMSCNLAQELGKNHTFDNQGSYLFCKETILLMITN